MANEDLIRGGTASVTAGLVTVTGQGVSWGNVREGDFFGAHVGLAVPITAIAGNVITLAYAWTGPTQVAAAYAIQPKGDVTRFQDRVRQLVESLTNGTLAALTAAGSATDKIAYYTGAGVAALTDFKASARSLLGLVPAANKLPYFTDENTAGLADLSGFARTNVLSKADRAALLASNTGIGVSENLQKASRIATDLNNEFIGGWVSGIVGVTANLPPNGGEYVVVRTLPWTDGQACTQTAYMYGAPFRVWKRSRLENGTWHPWVAQAGAILGTVAQVSGVPSGAIIERGSNANGDYVRLADGTQFCWRRIATGDLTIAAGAFATIGLGAAVAFAVAFNSTPSVMVSYGGGWGPYGVATLANPSPTDANTLYLTNVGAASRVFNGNIMIMAMGRWF